MHPKAFFAANGFIGFEATVAAATVIAIVVRNSHRTPREETLLRNCHTIGDMVDFFMKLCVQCYCVIEREKRPGIASLLLTMSS